VKQAVERLRRHTDLPIAVGFGIKTAETVAEIASTADASVVGSAIVQRIADDLDKNGRPSAGLVDAIHNMVRELSSGLRA
jgi:tryptophan synthase alpha chain